MDGLYEAIGKIASAAHATGDDIDANAMPSDSNNHRHGLDVFHRGHYYRFRAAPSEPKFTVGSPLTFASRLREQYTKEKLEDRVDADFASVTPDEQDAIVDRVLRSDLTTATEHEDEFEAALQEDVSPTRVSILRMTYGDDELWNGVFIRDDVFVQRDTFDVSDYRDTVEQIRSTKIAIGEVMSETIPPLQNDYIEDRIEPDEDTTLPDSIAFY